MDMQAIKDEIILKLTGDVLDLELSDASLVKIINSSLREVQRYIDTFALITVPYSKCIDMKPYKVNAVTKVYRTMGYLGENGTDNDTMTVDPLYASQWQLLNSLGNIHNTTEFAYRLASWSSMQQIRNTMSTDLSFMYDKAGEKLYINISQDTPKEVTIMYIPRFDDVSQITSDFWIDVLIRMAVATAKITVGRVRTKFKQSNALWTMDGDTLLQEGSTELAALREELKASTQVCYPYD
jgi:hypothetical protein